MSNFIDITGQRFGTLTVIKPSARKTKGNGTYWLCECDCGRKLLVRLDNLKDGRTTRCSKCRGSGGMTSIFVWEEGELNGVI